MTVSSATNRVDYSGNGSSTVFAVPFYFLADSHLLVVLKSAAGVDTTQVLGTNYTVSGAGVEAGGTVTMNVAPATGTTLTISRNVPLTQETDLQPNDRLPAESLEDALDKLTMIDQQINENAIRAIKVPVTDSTTLSTTLDTAAVRANKYLAFNNIGEPIATTAPAGIATVNETQIATAGQTVFSLANSYVPGISNLDVFVDGVNQYPGTAYTETNSNTVTFASGLHAGAEVRFTTARTLSTTQSDAATTTYVPAGTGAVQTNVQAKLRETVSVKDFGAVGDGVTDDTAAIQAAVDASKTVAFGGADDSYKVTAPITLRSGQMLVGCGATVTQATADTEIFNAEGLSNIDIGGFNFVGKGDDYIDSDSARAVAVYGGTSGSNIHVHDNTFTDFCYSTVRFANQSNVSFVNNTVVGPDATVVTSSSVGRIYGVIADAGCDGVLIANNDIKQGAQGARIERVSNVRIVGNRFYNILGQHGVYAGSGLTNVAITGNTVFDTRLAGIKVQSSDATAQDNTNISITGNTVYDCTDQGIMVVSAVSGATYKNRQVTVVGNTVKSAANGVRTDNCVGIVIANNTFDLCTQSGVAFDEDSQVVIEGNLITRSVNSAIRDIVASTFVTIKNNVIKDCCTGNTVGDEYGIFIQSLGSDYVIDGNVITDANGNMERAIYLAADINATTTLTNNVCPDGTAGTNLRLSAATAFRQYQNNLFTGSSIAINLPAVASASTIALSLAANVFSITGTIGITSITANGHSGHTVTLIFAGVLTVTDGSNLKLAGNFTTAANNTLTLCSDGTNWYEIARSVN